MALISVVVPVYNEEECLESLFERLDKLQAGCEDSFGFVFVDDGSRDRSLEIIRGLAGAHDNVSYVSFSRNFGHEVATTAGLDYADGDAVVIIDADLQDPPEVIPELIAKWREGFQVVYAQRRVRRGETWFKRISAWMFYRFMGALCNVEIPPDTGDFRLMDRRVILEVRRCREHSRFIRGLVSWVGFKQAGVLYDRDERHGGETKYGVLKLILLALDAVIGFSHVPLRWGSYLGMLVCLFSILMAVYIVAKKLIWGIEIPGYALMTTGVFFLGGTQLLMLGLLGEYVGRIYRESQQRPLYIVAEQSDEQRSVD